MKFNIKEAFTYYFKDSELHKKITVLYCAIVLATIFSIDYSSLPSNVSIQISFKNIISLLSIIPVLFLVGFYYTNTNKRIYKPDNNLAEITEWKNIFFVGFKNISAEIVMNTIINVLIILALIAALIICFASKMSGISLNSIMHVFALIPKISIFFIILGVIAVLCLLITALEISFSTDLRFLSYFDFKKVKHIIFNNFFGFIRLILWQMLLSIAFCIMFVLIAITIVGILLLPLLIIYFALAFSELRAQFIRHAFKAEENSSEDTNGEAVNGES